MTKAVDAVPQEVQKHFLKAAYAKSEFWGDMFTLCDELGLRNSEARQLTMECVCFTNMKVTLRDSKQVRAHITKAANKAIDAAWLVAGRKWLRSHIDDPMISLIVRLPTDTKQLANLAKEYDLFDAFESARLEHYEENIEAARAGVKSAPKGREIDFSKNQKVINILSKRIAKWGRLCGWLFPVFELGSNRAKHLEPISRQSVYRAIAQIREDVEQASAKLKEALQGVRTGLHSFRKAAVQRVADVMGDVLAASIWIGHGNGGGDLATTQNYLNKSARRMDEINNKLALVGAGGAYE